MKGKNIMTINEQLDNLSKDMRTDMGIICRIVYRRCQQYTLDEMKDIISRFIMFLNLKKYFI